MDKILFRFYITLISTFIVIINVVPLLFININNFINLIDTKWDIFFNKSEIEVNIDLDKSNIIIMFDDGWKSQYEIAYKYMIKKNMRGSIAIIPSVVDDSSYANMANIYEMYDSKWDILNHTYSHVLLPSLTYFDQKKEIEKSVSWFKNKKIVNNLNLLVYPEGLYNYNTTKILKELNFISARSTIDGYNTNIIDDKYNIKIKDVKSFIQPSTVIEWINYSIDNKLTLILLFHNLSNKITSDMSYKIDDFFNIIDYIEIKKESLNIITYSDWIRAINLYNQW